MYAKDYNFTQHPNFHSILGSGTSKRSLNYTISLPNLPSATFSSADIYVFFRKLYFVPGTTSFEVSYKIIDYSLNQLVIEISVEDGVQLEELCGYILVVAKETASSIMS